jgi:hypothetical protein
MMLVGLLSNHGQKAMIRMIGISSASSAAKPVIEAFKTTGSAQMPAFPGRESLLDPVVGDRWSKISALGGDRLKFPPACIH